MKLKLDLKKLIILFLARTKSTVKIAGKIGLLLVVLAEKNRAYPIDEIDDRKSNRSIDANRCMLVNWHRLVSANR